MGNTKTILGAALLFAGAVSVSAADRYKVETLVPGSPMHGVHGLAIGPDGAVYACSLTGHAIYRIDRRSGETTVHVGSPRGSCDDLAFSTDGTLAWTNGGAASVFTRDSGGKIAAVATGVPGLNSINYAKDGRLFFTRIFGGDGLYEANLAGGAPRAVVEKVGGLNGFEIKDGFVYGPLFFKGKVVKVDTETGAMTDVATGFMQPAAVNFDPQGRLVVLDYTTGEVMRLEGEGRHLLATLPPPIDNLAIAADGKIFVSSSAYNGITEIDPETLATRRLTWGGLSAPGTVAVESLNARDTLFVADAWGPRTVDPSTGTVTALPRTPGVAGATTLTIAGDKFLLANVWPFGVVQVVDRANNKLIANLPGFGAPYGLQPVSDGFIVADYKADRLIHVDNDKDNTRRPLPANLDGPVGLADAGGGVFYVTEYGKKDKRGRFLNGMVSKVDSASGARTVVARKLNRPEGIAIAGDGRLIVAETGARRVIALDPAGKKKPEVLAEKLALGLDVGDHVAAPFMPTGVAVGADGAIYVTGDVDNVVYRLTAIR
ncbi:MAG: hypothetical protein FJX59_06815 [Alphaproteobacteria bacterium]|nr:hypothetical protein [Alphaproteobacteria bacterium]